MTRSRGLMTRLICAIGAIFLAGQFVGPSITSAATLSSDVSIAKVGNGPVTAGQQAVFTITAANAGPDAANITLTDTLNGFTPTSITTGCPPGGTFVGGTTCQSAPVSGTCVGGGAFTSTFGGGFCQITPTSGTCTGGGTYTPTAGSGFCRVTPTTVTCPAVAGQTIVFQATDGACEYNPPAQGPGQTTCTAPYALAPDLQTCIYAPATNQVVCATGYTATSAPGPANTGAGFNGTYCQAAPTALTCATGYAQTTASNGTLACRAAPAALACAPGFAQTGTAGSLTCQAQLTSLCSVTGGVLTCTFANVGAGTSRTIQLVRNTSAADCGHTFTDTATVTGSNPDPVAANNTSTSSIAVTCTTTVPPTTGVVTLCGQVTSYQSSTTVTTGTVTINGMTFPIAANITTTTLTHTFYCLTLTFTNGFVTGMVPAANLANAQLACGVFTPVTAGAGALTTLYVGSMLFALQPGLTVPAWLLAYHGQTLCFFLNANGQIIGILTNIPTSIRALYAHVAANRWVARPD